MEVAMLQLPPGDSGLIDKIVCQLKSHGIFDQFRKECIADVDTKPAYQNLRQRVEGSVSSFLTNQEWRADLNKNQLRDSLRKHIHESGFLDIGVERIVDQVVNPKIYTVFFPKVEDVVYGFLGVEKPKKGADIQNSIQACTPKFEENPKSEKKFVSLIDLLPTDLDPISPEKLDSDEDIDENSVDKQKINSNVEVEEPNVQKVKVKEELISDVENDFDEDEKDEEEEDDDDEASPPFESLEGDAMDANATPPILPLHSADMLDNITSSSSSSETKDLLQYGEVRKRYPEAKPVLPELIKKEVDGEGENCLPSEQVKPETMQLNSTAVCTVKKEEKEKKEVLEPRKECKKVEKKEEKPRESSERKDESRSRKTSSDTREVKDRHSYDKKRSDREQVTIKQEKEESKRNEKEEQKKVVKEEHKRSEKDEHRKSEEVRKTDREKDDVRKSEKGDKKHGEKEEAKKVDKEKDLGRRHDKEDRKNAKERDDKDKEERKSVKDREEKRNDKDKKCVRDKDEHRKAEKEREESRRSEKEKSDSRKRDKRDEKKNDKEKDEKKVGKERDDSKKVEKEDSKKAERDESRRIEKDKNDKEKDKHRSAREKSEHAKGEKDTKDRIKSDHKEKESKHGSSKSGGENAKKDVIEKDHQSKLLADKKKEDNLKKAHHRDSSKTGSSKDRRVGEKEKKVSSIDDHRHERDKGKNGHRRSDRDKDRERERSQADGATQQTLGKEGSGPTSSTSSATSDGTKGSGDNSGSGGGGGSERTKDEELSVKVGADKEDEQEKKEVNSLDMYSCLNNTSGNLVLKIKKPKIAANIYEVKKIIQVRKNLKKLERERLVSSIAANQKADEAVAEPASPLESLNKNKSIAEPPKVKRAKLGAVEQDLRVEVESVLEKGLLEGEDGEIGAVHYLEEYPNLPECISYVHSLTEETASGDLTRVPSPTNSIATIELSDFEDYVILSDVELSKDEEEIVIKLGGQIERKSNKLKSPKKSSPLPPLTNVPEITGESSNKRPRRPNPRYNSGEYSVYSDEDVDDDDDMTDSASQKKVPLVDDIRHDHWKTPKERNLEIDEDIEAISHHESSSGSALPISENDAGSEDRETPVLSKKNQAAAEERRKMGRRLGVRGPLRRIGVSPGTPDTFVMPLSPESDVSTASGDAGKKASLGTRAIENQYNQGDIDGDLGPEDFDDDGDGKQPRLPLGPPLTSVQKGCDIRGHAGDMHHSHDDIGHPSSELPDGEKTLDDGSGCGPRRLRGTRSSSRVQQRYSSDDLYKPRPNITLGRRNRGRNSPTQGWNEFSSNDDSTNTLNSKNCVKRGRRGSTQGSEDMIVEGCLPNKRRRR